MDPRVPHGPHGWEDHSFSMLPFLGSFLFLLVILGLALTALYLWRQGKLPLLVSEGRELLKRRPSAFSPSVSPAVISPPTSSWSDQAS
jgi:hypothetical protein